MKIITQENKQNQSAEEPKTIKPSKPIRAISKLSSNDESRPQDMTAPPTPAATTVTKKEKKIGAKQPAKPSFKDVKITEVKAMRPSVSDEIWGAIKYRDLGLFGLSGQLVEKYCFPFSLDPNKCYLKYKVSSVIPALEGISSDFNFEVVGSYIVLTKKV